MNLQNGYYSCIWHPWTSSLALVEALRTNKKMRYIVVRHEENAAMAASAYNKLTGKIAACLTIAGPGASNLATVCMMQKRIGLQCFRLTVKLRVSISVMGVSGDWPGCIFKPITVYNNTIYDKLNRWRFWHRRCDTQLCSVGLRRFPFRMMFRKHS